MLPTGPGRRAPFPLCPRPSSWPVLGLPPPDHPARRTVPGASGTHDREAPGEGAPGRVGRPQLHGSRVRAQIRWRQDFRCGHLSTAASHRNLTTHYPIHWLQKERLLRARSLGPCLKRGYRETMGQENVPGSLHLREREDARKPRAGHLFSPAGALLTPAIGPLPDQAQQLWWSREPEPPKA